MVVLREDIENKKMGGGYRAEAAEGAGAVMRATGASSAGSARQGGRGRPSQARRYGAASPASCQAAIVPLAPGGANQ
jgi:hypothetical protein